MNATSCVNLKACSLEERDLLPTMHPPVRGRGETQQGEQGGSTMANQININRPTTRIVIISVILAILALIGHFSRVQFLTEYQFWLAMIAYVALLVGVLFKGL
jgi:hypothetical protein